MAERERSREQILEVLTDAVIEEILSKGEDEETTIAELAGAWYKRRGYEFRQIDLDHGYAWTKDGGATYSLDCSDLFDVLERVTKRLKGRRVLDFSAHDGKVEGLPYNLTFKIKRV